jgi:ATP-dependent protease ClpP protease subunit
VIAAALALALSAAPLPEMPFVEAGTPVAHVYLTGEITEESAKAFSMKLVAAILAQSIRVHIDSPGGLSNASRLIVSVMSEIQSATPIECVVDGMAASAAFLILQACPVRVARPCSRLITHEPYIEAAEFTATRTELRALLTELDASVMDYAKHCIARSKMSMKDFLAKIQDRDWEPPPGEALKLGFLDRVEAGQCK